MFLIKTLEKLDFPTFCDRTAPASLRGIYFSLESQCWVIGFLIGPSLGGWALDHPTTVGAKLWLYFVLSAVIALGLLILLRREIVSQTLSAED